MKAAAARKDNNVSIHVAGLEPSLYKYLISLIDL